MKTATSRLLWALRYCAGFLPFFIIATAATQAAQKTSLPVAVMRMGMYFLPGLVLGVGVWRLAEKVASRQLNWGRFAVVHLLCGGAYSVAWHIVFFAMLFLTSGRTVALRLMTSSQVLWWLLTGLMVYGVLIGMASVKRLAEQVRERDINAVRAETLRVRAEMEAIRGQLDPHFLFNTLHSITALVREDPVRAEEALLQFGELLRHVISTKRDGADELPLGDELAFIDRYLALEKMRLGERLVVVSDCSPEARQCWIPAFTVQPLVENAIRHAVAPYRTGAMLTLSARLLNRAVEITVSDTGPGAERDAAAKSSGVGLGAIRQRLHLRHGDAASLKIDTSPGCGFRAVVTLPAVYNALVDSV